MATKTDLGYAGFVLDGPYDAGKLYHRNMVVDANGGSYAYKHNTPAAGIPVTDTSHWQQIAEKGDTGASITQAAFVGDDLVFTKDDAGTVALANAKPDLTGPQGPVGNVMYATFDIDFDTGELVMTIPDGYTGPTFSINDETGELEVSI